MFIALCIQIYTSLSENKKFPETSHLIQPAPSIIEWQVMWIPASEFSLRHSQDVTYEHIGNHLCPHLNPYHELLPRRLNLLNCARHQFIRSSMICQFRSTKVFSCVYLQSMLAKFVCVTHFPRNVKCKSTIWHAFNKVHYVQLKIKLGSILTISWSTSWRIQVW